MSCVLVIGSITVDKQILSGSPHFFKLGGVTTYGGITFQRHGLETVITCNLSEGDRRIAHGIFNDETIRVITSLSKDSTVFTNHVDRYSKRHQKIVSLGDPIDLKIVSPCLQECSHIHLGPLHAADISQDVICELKNLNTMAALDIQGYLRRSEFGPVKVDVAPLLRDALEISSFIKADKKELSVLLSHYGMSLSDFIERNDIEEVIVTNGKEGGFVATKDGSLLNFRAKKTDKIVDTTGAGDVFFASYLISRYYKKKSVQIACDYAAHMASLQISNKYILNELLILEKENEYPDG